ncbi:hypothetical protein DPSP01_013372 [Paraphaeosphaeria sporulosa]
MKCPAAILVAMLAKYDPNTLCYFIGSTKRRPASLLGNELLDFAREDETAFAFLQIPTAAWTCLVRHEHAFFAMGGWIRWLDEGGEVARRRRRYKRTFDSPTTTQIGDAILVPSMYS